MSKIAAVLLVMSSFLSGCVAYETPYRDSSPRYSERDRDRDGIANRYDRDRDGDGAPNYRDTRPDNQRRY